MSDILARLRVRETHGIRRFLYPVEAKISLPLDIVLPPKRNQLSLIGAEGQPVPFEKYPLDAKAMRVMPVVLGSMHPWRLCFPISIGPYEEAEFHLSLDGRRADLDDPLQLYIPEEGALLSSVPSDTVTSIQKRLTTSLTATGQIAQVVYDGVAQLRNASEISRQYESPSDGEQTWDFGLLTAWTEETIEFDNVGSTTTRAEITACKSWAMVTHRQERPKSGDEIVFTLPLATAAATLTCDFGVGNGTYGKLQAGIADEVVWETRFEENPHARWTITTDGRTDYVGEVATAEQFLPQRWFHLIDTGKSLAVAITKVPASCQRMTITLSCTGDITIAFSLLEDISGPAVFGVCYHFLNDVPAIAAATNPQSILLPPVVEVLPA